MVKDISQDQPSEETHRVRSGRSRTLTVPFRGAQVSPPGASGCSPAGKPTGLCRADLGCHCVSHGITGHVIEFQPPLPPIQPSDHRVDFFGDSPH